MAKLTLDDLNLHGKTVLMRVDFNVPLNEKQEITDDLRIRAALPSIQKIIADGGKAVPVEHPVGGFDDVLTLAAHGVEIERSFYFVNADLEAWVENRAPLSAARIRRTNVAGSSLRRGCSGLCCISERQPESRIDECGPYGAAILFGHAFTPRRLVPSRFDLRLHGADDGFGFVAL